MQVTWRNIESISNNTLDRVFEIAATKLNNAGLDRDARNRIADILILSMDQSREDHLGIVDLTLQRNMLLDK